MKLTFHYLALSFFLADAKSLRMSLTTTPDSDESRNLVDACDKKVVTYGSSTITIENNVENAIQEKRYLASGVDTIKVKTYASPDNWNILSTAKGVLKQHAYPGIPKFEEDPKYGECVKFGDKIVLLNGTLGKFFSEFTGQ